MIKPFETFSMSDDRRKNTYEQTKKWIYSYAQKKEKERMIPSLTSQSHVTEYQHKIRQEINTALGLSHIPKASSPTITLKELIYQDNKQSMWRMKLRIMEELDLYGILVLPSAGYCELAICCHGLLGTPEHICGVIDSANYNDALSRLLECGCAVFAPQLLLTKNNNDANWPDDFRSNLYNAALWSGISVAALEIRKIEGAVKCLKEYLHLEHAGICGLSFGGFYSLYSCAIIEELEWCICSCYFNNRYEILSTPNNTSRGWEFPGMGGKFGDAEVAALIAPRPLYVEVATRDPIVPFEPAKAEAMRVELVYRAMCKETNFMFDVFDGEHEFNLRKVNEFFTHKGGLFQ